MSLLGSCLMVITASHIHSLSVKTQTLYNFSPKTSLSAQKLKTLCSNQTFWLSDLTFWKMTALRNQAVIKITQFGEGQFSPWGILGKVEHSLIWQIRNERWKWRAITLWQLSKTALVNEHNEHISVWPGWLSSVQTEPYSCLPPPVNSWISESSNSWPPLCKSATPLAVLAFHNHVSTLPQTTPPSHKHLPPPRLTDGLFLLQLLLCG